MNSVGDCTEAVVEAGLRSEGDVVTVEDGSEREEEEEEEEKEEEEEEGGRGEAASGPRDHIKVRVLEYQKTEDDYSYTMEVVVNEGKPLLLHHGYEHFKWIYRLLAQRIDIGGHILPPLPETPVALQPHQELLGVPRSAMFGGYSRLACLQMETFLQYLADHPFFSMNHEVHTCLTSSSDSTHDTIGAPSLWTSITTAFSNYQLSSLQDTDEEFVEILQKFNERLPVLETCSQELSQLITAWQKMACAEMKLCEGVKEEGEWEVGRNDKCALSLSILSTIIDEHQKYDHSASTDVQNTIGFTLDFQHRYSKQAKEMLYRRLEKVQALISASRQLDKARAEKKETAEQVRAAAMTDYNAINSTAKAEMDERYTVQWTVSLRNGLVNMAEAQLTHSRCLMAQLASLHGQLTAS